ncbi:hypothetical protein K7432_001786 [Basidiobolus ranarum]|uniref:Uncharacterized protein n=1 Tax=Basidiobolus ranarum TaxID=34480 RepID=A0ABR2W8X6_9FUNG
MSDSHRPSKNFGKRASDASNILASSQSKKAGKVPDRTSAFSGIANSTRSLFRSFLGGSVANGSSTNANLASILSNKPGNSTPFSGNAINPLESSSQWAESINDTSQTGSYMEGSSAHHAFESIGQRSVAGPSLEDELQHFEDVNTSSNSGQDYSENSTEQQLDTSFVTERESIQPLNEEFSGPRFPLNNRFSLKSAPQVGLYVNNTEPLLISPDKTATTSAESRAYAWADEFLSHFGENLIESPIVESNHENEEEFNTDNSASHPFESHDIPNYLSEQSLHISSENQRSIPNSNDSEVEFNSNPVELGQSFASAEPNTKSSLGSIIQSPKYLASEQDEFTAFQSEHGEASQRNPKDLEELEEAWQQTFRGDFSNTQTNWPSETDGDDVVAFLNSTEFPEELLPSSSDISVVEQVYNGEDTYSEWAAEFKEESENNLPESQKALNEPTKDNGHIDWSTEFLNMGVEGDNLNHLHEDDQNLAEHNLLPFETSEDTDGNDVVAFLNSQEFPEELALNSNDKSSRV